MENNGEIVAKAPDYDSHKERIAKWVQILLICQVARLLVTVLGEITPTVNILRWISRIISITIIVSLFNLSAVNERYRKAALFSGISVGGGILSSLLNLSMFGIVLSVFAILASYHELNANAEIAASKDEKLSKRWHSLFYLDLCIGILSGLIAIIPIMVAVFSGAGEDVIDLILFICITGTNIFLEFLHLIYYKKTLELYKQ